MAVKINAEYFQSKSAWSVFSLLLALGILGLRISYMSFLPLLGVLCIQWGLGWGFLAASASLLFCLYRELSLSIDPLFFTTFLLATFCGWFLFYVERQQALVVRHQCKQEQGDYHALRKLYAESQEKHQEQTKQFTERCTQLELRLAQLSSCLEESQALCQRVEQDKQLYEQETEQLKRRCKELTEKVYADTQLEPSYEDRQELQQWKEFSSQLEKKIEAKQKENQTLLRKIANLEEQCVLLQKQQEEETQGCSIEQTALIKQLQRLQLQKQSLEEHTQALYELISYLSAPKKTSSKASP